MIINMYTIWDDAAEEAGPPFCAKTDQVALRQFFQLIDGTTTKNDYTLYQIGTYDTEKMALFTQHPEMPREIKDQIISSLADDIEQSIKDSRRAII